MTSKLKSKNARLQTDPDTPVVFMKVEQGLRSLPPPKVGKPGKPKSHASKYVVYVGMDSDMDQKLKDLSVQIYPTYEGKPCQVFVRSFAVQPLADVAVLYVGVKPLEDVLGTTVSLLGAFLMLSRTSQLARSVLDKALRELRSGEKQPWLISPSYESDSVSEMIREESATLEPPEDSKFGKLIFPSSEIPKGSRTDTTVVRVVYQESGGISFHGCSRLRLIKSDLYLWLGKSLSIEEMSDVVSVLSREDKTVRFSVVPNVTYESTLNFVMLPWPKDWEFFVPYSQKVKDHVEGKYTALDVSFGNSGPIEVPPPSPLRKGVMEPRGFVAPLKLSKDLVPKTIDLLDIVNNRQDIKVKVNGEILFRDELVGYAISSVSEVMNSVAMRLAAVGSLFSVKDMPPSYLNSTGNFSYSYVVFASSQACKWPSCPTLIKCMVCSDGLVKMNSVCSHCATPFVNQAVAVAASIAGEGSKTYSPEIDKIKTMTYGSILDVVSSIDWRITEAVVTNGPNVSFYNEISRLIREPRVATKVSWGEKDSVFLVSTHGMSGAPVSRVEKSGGDTLYYLSDNIVVRLNGASVQEIEVSGKKYLQLIVVHNYGSSRGFIRIFRNSGFVSSGGISSKSVSITAAIRREVKDKGSDPSIVEVSVSLPSRSVPHRIKMEDLEGASGEPLSLPFDLHCKAFQVPYSAEMPCLEIFEDSFPKVTATEHVIEKLGGLSVCTAQCVHHDLIGGIHIDPSTLARVKQGFKVMSGLIDPRVPTYRVVIPKTCPLMTVPITVPKVKGTGSSLLLQSMEDWRRLGGSQVFITPDHYLVPLTDEATRWYRAKIVDAQVLYRPATSFSSFFFVVKGTKYVVSDEIAQEVFGREISRQFINEVSSKGKVTFVAPAGLTDDKAILLSAIFNLTIENVLDRQSEFAYKSVLRSYNKPGTTLSWLRYVYESGDNSRPRTASELIQPDPRQKDDRLLAYLSASSEMPVEIEPLGDKVSHLVVEGDYGPFCPRITPKALSQACSMSEEEALSLFTSDDGLERIPGGWAQVRGTFKLGPGTQCVALTLLKSQPENVRQWEMAKVLAAALFKPTPKPPSSVKTPSGAIILTSLVMLMFKAMSSWFGEMAIVKFFTGGGFESGLVRSGYDPASFVYPIMGYHENVTVRPGDSADIFYEIKDGVTFWYVDNVHSPELKSVWDYVSKEHSRVIKSGRTLKHDIFYGLVPKESIPLLKEEAYIEFLKKFVNDCVYNGCNPAFAYSYYRAGKTVDDMPRVGKSASNSYMFEGAVTESRNLSVTFKFGAVPAGSFEVKRIDPARMKIQQEVFVQDGGKPLEVTHLTKVIESRQVLFDHEGDIESSQAKAFIANGFFNVIPKQGSALSVSAAEAPRALEWFKVKGAKNVSSLMFSRLNLVREGSVFKASSSFLIKQSKKSEPVETTVASESRSLNGLILSLGESLSMEIQSMVSNKSKDEIMDEHLKAVKVLEDKIEEDRERALRQLKLKSSMKYWKSLPQTPVHLSVPDDKLSPALITVLNWCVDKFLERENRTVLRIPQPYVERLAARSSKEIFVLLDQNSSDLLKSNPNRDYVKLFIVGKNAIVEGIMPEDIEEGCVDGPGFFRLSPSGESITTEKDSLLSPALNVVKGSGLPVVSRFAEPEMRLLITWADKIEEPKVKALGEWEHLKKKLKPFPSKMAEDETMPILEDTLDVIGNCFVDAGKSNTRNFHICMLLKRVAYADSLLNQAVVVFKDGDELASFARKTRDCFGDELGVVAKPKIVYSTSDVYEGDDAAVIFTTAAVITSFPNAPRGKKTMRFSLGILVDIDPGQSAVASFKVKLASLCGGNTMFSFGNSEIFNGARMVMYDVYGDGGEKVSQPAPPVSLKVAASSAGWESLSKKEKLRIAKTSEISGDMNPHQKKISKRLAGKAISQVSGGTEPRLNSKSTGFAKKIFGKIADNIMPMEKDASRLVVREDIEFSDEEEEEQDGEEPEDPILQPNRNRNPDPKSLENLPTYEEGYLVEGSEDEEVSEKSKTPLPGQAEENSDDDIPDPEEQEPVHDGKVWKNGDRNVLLAGLRSSVSKAMAERVLSGKEKVKQSVILMDGITEPMLEGLKEIPAFKRVYESNLRVISIHKAVDFGTQMRLGDPRIIAVSEEPREEDKLIAFRNDQNLNSIYLATLKDSKEERIRKNRSEKQKSQDKKGRRSFFRSGAFDA